jgi:hypothetical protein
MTERHSRLVLPLGLGALAVALAVTTIYFARDEYQELARSRGEDIGTQTVADEKIGPGRLRLPPAELSVSGIEVAALEPGEAQAAVEVYGTVVDIAPLVDARGRYFAMTGEVRALRTAAGIAEAEYRRAADLFRDDRNVSERVMRTAEADWKAARDRLAIAEANVTAAREAMRIAWGGPLAEMALNPGSPAFAPLLEQREVLLRMIVPYGTDNGIATRVLTIEPPGGGQRASCRLVSVAPGAETGMAGATYLYRAPAAGLRVGARVIGHLSTGNGTLTGVVVPERAVVWHAGRPWVYVREPDNVFARTPVSTRRLVPGGWLNTEGLSPGQEVVVTGAQLLLSEELEYLIRNENED